MPSPHGPPNEFVRPAVRWSGTLPDADTAKAAPDPGVITWREPFAALWAAWGLGAEVPDVDFESYFVAVEVGPLGCQIAHLLVDGSGVGRAVVRCGHEPEPQHGYSIGVFPRGGVAAGVRTYRGKDVAKREEP